MNFILLYLLLIQANIFDVKLNKEVYGYNDALTLRLSNTSSQKVVAYLAIEEELDGKWREFDEDVLRKGSNREAIMTTILPDAEKEFTLKVKDVVVEHRPGMKYRIKAVYQLGKYLGREHDIYSYSQPFVVE